MKILFDVGANYGTDSLPKVAEDPDMICFAFEPTPYLVEHLLKESVTFKDRYYVIPYAVSNFNGTSEFYIAGDMLSKDKRGYGCSSLLKFANDLDKKWPGKEDLYTAETITVEVITLKKFIEELSPISITHIDYFHCDVQGSDLNVLYGLDKYIKIIKSGKVEAANKKDILYIDQNTEQDTVAYLVKHDFTVDIESNDIHHNEVNINFKKI